MGKTTVLIVEDEAIVAADLASKLGQLGYEVVGSAAEANEAVEMACSLKPAVVLMDIRLKGPVDGIEAAEAIRVQIDVPLIYLTAYSDAATLARAKLSGPFGYILKPFDERDLSTTIELAIYKHQLDTEKQRAHEALQESEARLQAVNEELQTANEELQAQSEELQTQSEELQAQNEELARLWEESSRAEEALRKSQQQNEFLADIVMHAAQPFGQGYPDGRLGLINKAFEELSGYSGKELKSIDWDRTLTPPEWRELEREKLDELNRTGTPVKYEKEYIRKDGTRVSIELLVHIVTDSEGNPEYYYSFVTDITERKRAEEDSARLAAIVESSGDAIIAKNLDGIILSWNAGSERLFGYRADEVIGKPITLLIPPELQEEEEKILLRLSADEMIENFETVRLSKDGRRIEVSLTVSPIKDSQGTIIGASKIARDITKRKQAERVLARYKLLAQHSRDIILFLRRDDGCIIEANAAAANTYGYDHDMLLGLTINDLRAQEFQEMTTSQMNEADRHGILFHTLHRRKDGSTFPVEVSSCGATIDGQRILISIIRDITERKQAETFRSMGQDILLVLSEYIDLREAIKRAFTIIKSATGVDAVGIRLQDEDDFPYFYQEGFPEDFLLKENSLLARNKDGGICRDECGDICLECTCGLVVTSKTDPSIRFFTKGGSAWTNDSIPFPHEPVDDDIRTNPRDECIHQGYASVALIPIRAKGRVVGLLQLNDRRKGCFTLEGIETLEKIAENIGESMLRKQAEEALKESETKYRELVQNANSVIIRWRCDGTLVFFNEYAQSLFGYGADEIIGRDVRILVPETESTGDDLTELIQNIVAHPANYMNNVNENVCRDGHRVWLAWTNKPIFDEHGRVAEILAVGVDISERKKAEEALQESEQRLRLAYTAANAGAWEWDLTTNQNIWSDELWELYGLTPHSCEPSYEVWLQTIHPDDRTNAMQAVQEAARDGKELTAEWRVSNFGGAERWLMSRGQPLCDDSGAVVRYIGIVLDITARKQAEEALRQSSEAALRLSEQEFRSLAEAMPQIVWATRPDGWNIYFNQQWVDYTGMTMEESFGHGWNKPFHPDDKQRAWDAWQRATQHNERYSLECRLRRADGVYRWWLIRGEPMRGANGEILKWFGTCTDIEELKRAEALLHEANALLEQRVAERTAALRESEALYRSIGESIDYGVWVCTADGRNTYASKSFLNMVGITQEQCSNFGWGDLLHPDDADRTIAAWQECVRTGSNWDIEHRFRGVDGQWHHVLARGVPVRNEHGEIISWAGINLDISRLKQAEESLRETRDYLENLLNYANAPIIVWDSSFRITRFNHAFEHLTGLNADEVIGKPLDILFPDKSRDESTRLIENTLSGERWETVEIPILHVNGLVRTVLWNSANILDKNNTKVVATIAQGQDITKRKQAEEALKTSLHEKEVLLKEIHHRVKNNMQVISSLVSLQADGSKDETVREVLRDVTYRVRSMALVHEKLYQSTDLARIDFAEYTRSLLGYLWRAHGAAAADVRLTLDLEPVALPVDTAVPCGLILNELVGNALKHAFRGRSEGEVIVSLQGSVDGRISLSVGDNGVGLPAGFDWRQAKSLGLRLVQMLARQIGAEVEVSGGEDAKFEIVFQIEG